MYYILVQAMEAACSSPAADHRVFAERSPRCKREQTFFGSAEAAGRIGID